MQIKKKISVIVWALLAGLMFTAPAQATLMLTLSDGDESLTLTDFSNSGAVLYVGTIGNWVLNVTLGTGDPIIGDDRTARIDLSSLNVTGQSDEGGTLTISLTNTNVTVPHGDTSYLVELGGTTGGEISFQSYVDSTNTAFGTETLLYDTGLIGSGAFSGSAFGLVGVQGPYSITTVATLTHDHGRALTGFNHGVEISEPAGLALLGIGLLALFWGIRRRSKSG